MARLGKEEQEFLKHTTEQNRENLKGLVGKTVTAIDHHPTEGLYLEMLNIAFDDGTTLTIVEQGQAGWFSASAARLRHESD